MMVLKFRYNTINVDMTSLLAQWDFTDELHPCRRRRGGAGHRGGLAMRLRG